MNPRITIGLPVFNDILFIEKSINSILNQTFTDFILIISDDGSTDGSEQICRGFEKKDHRVKYIRQETNLGISRNMQFLLSLAQTPYFMWAGDDDLMDETYVEKLYNALDNNINAISAFSTCALIDEYDNELKRFDFDYQNNNLYTRLKNYIKDSTDYFGYGLFKTERIKGVTFPVWWWPNKKSPYNNIFPTLVYYLAKGNYIHVYDRPLFLKRVKTEKHTHHQLTGKGNGFKESIAYWIRKFNLTVFTSRQIRHSSNIALELRCFPLLFWHWFIKPSWEQLVLAMKAMARHIPQ